MARRPSKRRVRAPAASTIVKGAADSPAPRNPLPSGPMGVAADVLPSLVVPGADHPDQERPIKGAPRTPTGLG